MLGSIRILVGGDLARRILLLLLLLPRDRELSHASHRAGAAGPPLADEDHPLQGLHLPHALVLQLCVSSLCLPAHAFHLLVLSFPSGHLSCHVLWGDERISCELALGWAVQRFWVVLRTLLVLGWAVQRFWVVLRALVVLGWRGLLGVVLGRLVRSFWVVAVTLTLTVTVTLTHR
jgi:hypothetical protein